MTPQSPPGGLNTQVVSTVQLLPHEQESPKRAPRQGPSPAAQEPLHSGNVSPHGTGDVVAVVVEVVVTVVVVGTVQLVPLPGAGHASQQLVQVPTVPSLAVQCAASLLILHFVPLVVVIQQVTAPAGFPQVERDAHFLTSLAHPLFTSTRLTCSAAQLT